MHSKVSSDWLPSYIKATQPVLEIFKLAGYFPDGPRIYSTLDAVKISMVLGEGVQRMGSGWYWLRLVTTGGALY